MIESQSRYINGLIKPVLDARRSNQTLSLSPKSSVIKDYNEKLQKELLNSSFNDPNCNSWYKNDAGIITNNWSRTVIDYQEQLADVNYEDFEVEGSGAEIVRKKKVQHVGRVKEETSVSDRTLLVLGAVSTAAVVGGFLMRNSRYLSGVRLR